MKVTGTKTTEVSGAYPSGETWHIKFDANGAADVKDEEILKALRDAAAHPDAHLKVKD